jgi:hypothetical protein
MKVTSNGLVELKNDDEIGIQIGNLAPKKDIIERIIGYLDQAKSEKAIEILGKKLARELSQI